MDSRTGELYEFKESEAPKMFEVEAKLGRRLVPLSKPQYTKLVPLSKRKRKRLLNGGACICGSGKSFKKCCSRRYK